MLELGTDIRIIQMLLGHRSIRTTLRYTRVTPRLVATITSPIDVPAEVRVGGEHVLRRAELLLIEQHAYDRSRFLRGARVDESNGIDAAALEAGALDAASRPIRHLNPRLPEIQILDKPISFDDRQARRAVPSSARLKPRARDRLRR